MSETPKTGAPELSPAPAAPEQQGAMLQVDESKALSSYANFCRVTGTPEEVIFDFGLNTQPGGPPSAPISINQRLIMSYFTAKRMLAALQMTIQRHEQAFGVLETDIRKRIVRS